MIRGNILKQCLGLLLGLSILCNCYSQPDESSKSDDQRNSVQILLDSAQRTLDASPEKALIVSKKAMELSFDLRDTIGFSQSLPLIQLSFEKLGEYDSAIYFFESNRNLYSIFPNEMASGKAYFYQGKMYRLQGDKLNALRHYELGIEQTENLTPSKVLGSLYNGLGLIYSELKDTAIAQKYLLKSLFVREQVQDSLGIAATLENIGNEYSRKSVYNKAITYYSKAILYYSALENSDGLVNATKNLANVYFLLDQYARADSLYRVSSNLISAIHDYDALSSLNQNYGVLNARLGKFKVAEKYFSKALENWKENSDPRLGKVILLNLGKVHELLGHHQKANEQYRQYIFIQDTLHRNLQKTAALARQLQRQNLQMRLEKEQAQAQSVRMELANRNLTIGIILGIVFLLIGIGWFFLRLRNRQRQSAFESRIDRMIQEQEQHMFGAVIRGQEQAYSQIAQELHDNIGMLLSATNLHFSNLEEKLDTQLESFQQAKSTLLKAVKEVRSLSRDMLSGTLHHLGLVEAVEELIDVLRQTGHYEIDFRTQGLAQVDLPPTMSHSLYRCVQELISNVIRHSHADHIRLSIICKQGQLSLEFEDNGIGFDLQEPKAGMGIKSLSARVSDLQGTFDVQSEIGQGTLVKILLDVPESRSEWISGQSNLKQD